MEQDTQQLLGDMESRMSQAVHALQGELAKLRTGRAHPDLLAHIKIESYGSQMPLEQVASVSVEGGQTLLIAPWDRQNVAAIEKAIQTSDLNLNPVSHGDKVRVTLPALTAERRGELMKLVGASAEKAKVSIRNVRRDGLQQLKDQVKAKTLTEDQERSAGQAIQKATDRVIASVNEVKEAKETELQTI